MYSFIEVCAGAGGLSCGLIKSGFKPLLLNDSNADCCKTLALNHPDTRIIHGKMESINYSEFIDKVDLLAGGVPCQSFSRAGTCKGLDDPRGNCMMHFAKILHQIKPKIFMIENVKGLAIHDSGRTLNKIIETLSNNGMYNITWKCLDSSKYNVPQKRERIFIIGTLHSSEFEFPKESTSRPVLRDALQDVPDSIGASYSDYKISLFKQIPPGGCWINLPVEIQKEYLMSSFKSGGGKRGILRRLSLDKPCLTLLCTPSQKQTERCHPIDSRPLTIAEYARIQTFDDNYQFVGKMSSIYKQIGNAVPVELAFYMGESISNYLGLIN